ALASGWRPADAEAQAPVVMRADALRDVAQAVVAGDAAALLQAGDAGLEVQLVMGHENLFRLDLEEAGKHLHRAAAPVHEALGEEQPGTGGLDTTHQRLELR